LIEAYVLNEIVVLSRLRHDSIVEFKGAGVKGNNIYIINNYCPKTLRKYLRTQDRYFRTPESLSRKLDILIQIARGMEYLHCHNIVHGDLSTHIVWQSEKGNFQLADFRLSKLDLFGNHVISSHYKTFCAPEVLKECIRDSDLFEDSPENVPPSVFDPPSNDETDKREEIRGRMTTSADIYPFGIIMYEVMTCEVPYASIMKLNQKARTLAKIIYKHHLRPTDVDDGYSALGVPESYTTLMKRCWDQDSDRRPESYTEIISELLEIQRKIESRPRALSNSVSEANSQQTQVIDSRAGKKLRWDDAPLPFQEYLPLWRLFNQPKALNTSTDPGALLLKLVSLFGDKEVYWYDSVTVLFSHEGPYSSMMKNIDMMILSENMLHFVQQPMPNQDYSLFHTKVNFRIREVTVLHSYYDPRSIAVIFKKNIEASEHELLDWIHLRIKLPPTGSDPMSMIEKKKAELLNKLRLLSNSVIIKSVANVSNEVRLYTAPPRHDLVFARQPLTEIFRKVVINYKADYESLSFGEDPEYICAVGRTLFQMNDQIIHLTDKVVVAERNRLQLLKRRAANAVTSISDAVVSSSTAKSIQDVGLMNKIEREGFILVISDVALYLFHDKDLYFVKTLIRKNSFSYYKRIPLAAISTVVLSEESVTTMLIKLKCLMSEDNMTTDIYIETSYHVNEICQKLRELIPNLIVEKVQEPIRNMEFLSGQGNLCAFPQLTLLRISRVSKLLKNKGKLSNLTQSVGIVQNVIYLSKAGFQYDQRHLAALFCGEEGINDVVHLNSLQKKIIDDALEYMDTIFEQKCIIKRLQYAVANNNVAKLLEIEELINVKYKARGTNTPMCAELDTFLNNIRTAINLLKNKQMCLLRAKALMLCWLKKNQLIDKNDTHTMQILQAEEFQHLYETNLRFLTITKEMLDKWIKLCQTTGEIQVAQDLSQFVAEHFR
jgi:serine/threonine protein kinase